MVAKAGLCEYLVSDNSEHELGVPVGHSSKIRYISHRHMLTHITYRRPSQLWIASYMIKQRKHL